MPIVNDSPLSIEAGEYWATNLYITHERISGTLVPYDGTVIVDDPALVVASGDDLRDQLEAALRIIADDNKIDVQQAQQLVNQRVRT